MASITLKDIPEELHAQLKQEAAANFRSLTQEALARIERSFALQDQLSAARVNALIAESLNSGPDEPLTRAKFEAARKRARVKFAARHKAA
jgi:plasmid stability protein